MTSIVDATGTAIGLNFEKDEYLDVAQYASFSKLDVQWSLTTALPAAAAPTEAPPPEIGPDHCAPNISKAERLKRLATYGKLRQTNDGSYSVAHRRVTFSSTTWHSLMLTDTSDRNDDTIGGWFNSYAPTWQR